MTTERMAVILDHYNDKRTATEQFLNSTRENRKKGFQLVNTIHALPDLEQIIWASRLLLDNSGVTITKGNDIEDSEFKEALLKAFEYEHPILGDAKLLLDLAIPSNRLKC